MRNAGDGTPGGSTGRRQRVPASAGTSRPAGNGGASLFTPAYRVDYGAGTADQQAAEYRWSEFDQPPASYRQADYPSGAATSAWADDGLPGGYSGYSWLTDDQGAGVSRRGNAVRGLPPVPDEPLPVYPPGPFAAWNRGTSARGDGRASAGVAAADLFEQPGPSARPTASAGPANMLATATITPDEFDTNHSLPAIKDPVLTGRDAAGVSDRGSAAGSRSASRGSTPATAPARGRDRHGHGSGKSSARRGSAKSKRSKRQPVRLAIGTATVIVAAVAAILVITSIGKPGTNSSANNKPDRPRTSASPTPSRPAGRWGYIATRQTDPVPLALTELFPHDFIAGSSHYFVTITKTSRNCHAALIGTALQTAVRQAKCSQVLRASYMARFQNAMATIGVFNLASSAGASTAAPHAGPAEFVAELPAKTGVTDRLGQGSGIEEAVVKGHYLVLAWAEYIDLSAPTTYRERQHLTDFMNTVIRETINKSLSYRMVDGKPPPPG